MGSPYKLNVTYVFYLKYLYFFDIISDDAKSVFHNRFVHSGCVHIQSSCPGSTDTITIIVDIRSTLFEVSAPFPDVLHSYYIIFTSCAKRL